MEVTCDNCNAIFKIDLKADKLENDIEQVYFQCPNCFERYDIHKTNTITRELSQRLLEAKQGDKKAIEDELKQELALLNEKEVK